MMNELIFLTHSLLVAGSALVALRLGKEALIGYICLLVVLANLFVTKQITLLGFNATASDAFSIGAVVSLNLLQEYYGRAITQKTIWISFFILIVYSIVSYVHLCYLPSPADTMHPHFMQLLSCMPRIVLASLGVYLLVQLLDAWLFGILKNKFADRYLTLRYCASISICQLLDTILFSLVGLYGIVDNIGQIIMVSYLVKLAAIACATPCVAVSTKFVKK